MLVSRAEDLESFDRAFAAWFLRSPSRPAFRGASPGARSRPGSQNARAPIAAAAVTGAATT